MKIGVSSCLIGNKVRYDGQASNDSFISKELSQYFELIPYCPETILWGSPREAIRLVEEKEGEIKVVTSTKNPVEVTKQLRDISKVVAQEAYEDELCGFVLKSKSPTCGLDKVKVYKPLNAPSEKKGVGLFASELKKIYPYLPIEEEGRLNDPWLRENFLMQVFAYGDLKQFLKSNPSFNDLVVFHTSYKYLIYAKSEASYKTLGRLVANHEKKQLDEVLSVYKEEFLKAISLKGNIKKTYNVLLHIYGYFKKNITKDEKDHILITLEEYKEKIIPLIAVIKIINLYVKRFDEQYLKAQKFLNPYPKELALRSDVRAYK